MDKPSITLPPSIPDHELIRRIGSGSYGEVWLARTQMGTFRAVKVVYGERFGDDERPFERELKGLANYEPISRSHPGLVAILHFGRKDREYFYYVMELGDDRQQGTRIDPAVYVPRTLAIDSKTRRRMPVKECVELGIALADALQELHRHDLVHRDIKPSNIIFVNGRPKLADIGLIADMAEARSYVGTEGFIAPEGPGRPQGDIYSLGKLLYEVSTGKDRIDFPTLPEDLAAAKDNDFLELNEVLLKACDVELERRYKTAKEVESDLTLLRSGESVRRLRRLERVVGVLKKAALAALVIVPVLLLAYFQMDYRKKKAAEIRQLQLGGHLAEGTYALNRGDYSGSLSPFLDAAMLDSADAHRSRTHRLRLKQVLDRCPKLVQVFFHDETQLDQVEFLPSEELILTSTYWGKAQIWNVRTGEPVGKPFASGKYMLSASASPDGKYVVTADQQGLATVWLAESGAVVTNMVHARHRVESARFSPGGNEIVLAGGAGIVEVRDFPSGVIKTNLTAHTNHVIYAGYSRDGKYLLTGSRDSAAIIWNAKTFEVIHRLAHGNWVHNGDFSPDGRLAATASFDRQARLWDLRTGEQLYPEMPHGDGVYSARFSPDGGLLLTACLDGVVRLWDVFTRQLIAENAMIRHGVRVFDATFSADGRRILVACNDGTARIWDLAGGAAKAEASTTNFCSADGTLLDIAKAQTTIPELNVKGLSLSQLNPTYPKFAVARNGHFVLELKATGRSNEFQCQGWDVLKGKAIASPIALVGPEGDVSACISEDGKRALAYSKNAAQVYDLRSGKTLHGPLKPELHVVGGIFSSDNRWVAIYGSSKATVWDVESGKLKLSIPPYEGKVRYAEFNHDSRKLVVCTTSEGFDKCFAEIWSTETWDKVGKRLQHGDGVLMAAFSKDDRWVVTASEDFYATVWDAATGQQMVPSLLHETKVLCAAFSHDGEWIATASADRKLRLWDASTHKPLTPSLTFTGAIPSSIRFVKDDMAVFATTEDGSAWLWRLALETRPLEDLAWLYELVCGRGDFEANRFRTTPQARLKEAWSKFRKENAEDFEVSNTELSAWQR